MAPRGLELLAPAGTPEKARVAFRYGADAVYLGARRLGLRAAAGNFKLREIRDITEWAHTINRKVYVTINIFAHNRHLHPARRLMHALAAVGVDAFIISDPGIAAVAREAAPGIELHLSTQANMTNWRAASFWAGFGFSRIIAARELSLEEIREIRDLSDVGIESFVHGAMCMAYSGRCLMSSYMTGRSSNLGDCVQPCRWRYALVEEQRPGEYFPVETSGEGTYILSSRDLCMIEYLPDLVEAGVEAFKIEGRMKGLHYVATVTKAYREAIDLYWSDPGRFRTAVKPLRLELEKVSHRPYCTGFYFDAPDESPASGLDVSYIRTADFIAVVRSFDEDRGMARVDIRNHVSDGEEIEWLQPAKEVRRTRARMYAVDDGRHLREAHPNSMVMMPVGFPVERYDMIRRLI